MAGTFRGNYRSGNDSDKISEELYNAFNMDSFDAPASKSQRPKRRPMPGPSGQRRGSGTRKRRKKKDRQLIGMIGLIVTAFLLVVCIILGIVIFKVPAVACILILTFDVIISFLLAQGPIFLPIGAAVLELIVGLIFHNFAVAFMGILLMAVVWVVIYLIRS